MLLNFTLHTWYRFWSRIPWSYLWMGKCGPGYIGSGHTEDSFEGVMAAAIQKNSIDILALLPTPGPYDNVREVCEIIPSSKHYYFVLKELLTSFNYQLRIGQRSSWLFTCRNRTTSMLMTIQYQSISTRAVAINSIPRQCLTMIAKDYEEEPNFYFVCLAGKLCI